MQKKCVQCKEIKAENQFRINKKVSSGLSARCKDCLRQYSREYYFNYKEKAHKYYEKNKVQINLSRREYYKKNREKCRETGRKWHEAHRDYDKKYRIKNKERDAQRKKEYQTENRDKIRARQKKYYSKNKEKIAQRVKLYRQTLNGKLKKLAIDYKYRAREKNCEINDLTSTQIKVLLKKTKVCNVCNKKLFSKDKKALDHIIPLSRGGSNTLSNMQVIHLSCNSSKGNRDYQDYGSGQILMFLDSPTPKKKRQFQVITEKKCLECKIIKLVSKFHKNKASLDGFVSRCKSCMQISGKKHREKQKEFFALYPEKHQEQLEKERKWRKIKYQKDPEYYKKSYYKNVERNRANARKHREKNKEYYLEYSRKHKEYRRKYYIKNAARLLKLAKEKRNKNKIKENK